jgi:CBS-domain-containing membrane protein
LHDGDLLDVATRAHDHSRRQLAWLTTIVEHEAPDAIALVPDRFGQVAASLPKRPDSIAAIPDVIWGPVVAALLLLAVGVLGLVAGSPWLVPSLGPTAVLIAVMPLHPTARAWNTAAGHAGGLIAGFAAVALVGAATAPTVMGDHVLVPVRVLAAAIAIALTMLLGSLMRASHPPAAATTLLVALGGIATADQAEALLAGVLAITILGEGARTVRFRRRAPAERDAPRDSIIGRLLHRT